MERAWLAKKLEKLPSFIQHFYLLLAVLLGWVFFRSENLSYATAYFLTLFNFSSSSFAFAQETFPLFIMAIGILICFLPQKLIIVPTIHTITDFKLYHLIFQFVLAVFSILFLLSSSRNPFIYFNF